MIPFVRTMLALIAAVSVLAPTFAMADDAKPVDGAMKVTYDEHVKPILREHCFSCHNGDAKKGDLALDTYAGALKGGGSGEVIVAGDLDSSRLWDLVSHKDEP